MSLVELEQVIGSMSEEDQSKYIESVIEYLSLPDENRANVYCTVKNEKAKAEKESRGWFVY